MRGNINYEKYRTKNIDYRFKIYFNPTPATQVLPLQRGDHTQNKFSVQKKHCPLFKGTRKTKFFGWGSSENNENNENNGTKHKNTKTKKN